MNILITGAFGFIGQHLCKVLNDSGYLMGQVIGYDLVDGYDIRNLHDLDKAFEISQCDTVVHLAARAGVRRGDDYPDEYISTNILGTNNVVKMCEKYGCRLINFSSSSVYGKAVPPTAENDQKEPISLYGASKLAAEYIVGNAKCQTTIIRPFTVYGENGRGDQVFYKWLRQIKAGKPITVFTSPMGSSPASRGYTYVGDIVNVVVNLISRKWWWEHQDFNIGGSEIIDTQNLLDIFKNNVPDLQIKFLPRPSMDIPMNYADITKAREILDYNPSVQFEQNITKIIREELEYE